MSLALHPITFAYDGTISSLMENVTVHFPEGWTGVVGPNGAGKTTVLRLAAGDLQPQRGTIRRPEHIVSCPQRTDDAPEQLAQFIIAITGANGLGKSTLIRHILHRLSVPEEHLVYVPQEIDLARTRDIMAAVQRLSHEQLGGVMTVVSALGSRPERLLRNLDASPGELRKVLLALGVIRRPHLIIIDEPTNHLDLAAIESLEDALRDCPCGLLLVSHDLRFLARVAGTRWHLQQEGTTVTMTTSSTFTQEAGQS